MRKHGVDFGVWRQWAMPDNPPKPIDFVVAGITYGDKPNQMYEANKLALQDYSHNGGNLIAYHFYTPVNALSQIKAFVPRADEVGAFAAAVDWESTSSHTITASDVPVLKDIVYGLWQAFPKDRVMVYASHNKWKFLRSIDPDFADEVELWLTWPIKDPDLDHFHPYYVNDMGREFDEVRLLQYSWWGDAQAYGVLNTPTTIDLDVYVNKEPFESWIGTPPQPPEIDMGILEDMQANLDDVLVKLQDMDAKLDKILDLVEAAPPPVVTPDTIGKTASRDGNAVFLSNIVGYNAKGAPMFGFYPTDTAPVAERVFVESGTVVQVFAGSRLVGDGGRTGWLIDKDQLQAKGAPIPDVDLYLEEKFIA